MEASTLNEAWNEAEAALPSGWVLVGVMFGVFMPADLEVQPLPDKWVAMAATRTIEHAEGWGSSPQRALRALAKRLARTGIAP